MRLNFYTTEGCHLCEDAWQLVCELNLQAYVSIVEITDEEQLVAKYGVRIPVIENALNKQDIGWPFDAGILAKFVENA